VNDPAQFISYAQHGEDVILWRALGDRDGGFYVDVGAFDPTHDSVTRALYERGWRGINIEPQPDCLEAFERERPGDTNLSLAIGDHDGTAILTRPLVAGWATTLDTAVTGFDASTDLALEVPIRRLDTLLPELGVQRVDILKIDVEGAEPAVVRGFIEGHIRPLVCVVEGVAPGVGQAAGDEAVALLVRAGYLHCLFDGLNHYLTTDPALQPALSAPANPLDGHTRVAIVDLERERRELHATIAALASENLSLRAVPAPDAAAERAPVPEEPAGTAPAKASQVDEEGVVELVDSDLPLPATATADVGSAAVPPVSALAPQRSGLDPVARTARRRATFAQLLQVVPAPLRRSATGAPFVRLLTLAVTDPAPVEAISVLYEAILCREADPEGLAAWSNRLRQGQPLLALARELAGSDEALARSPKCRAQVLADLMVWGNLLAITELGVASWHPDRSHSPGKVAHEIFVEALFEVALQRHPSPDEARIETAKLVGGTGREWLLRAFAARPEARARLLGEPSPGLRGRVRHWQNVRRHVDTFRTLVDAAEGRHVSQMLASLSADGHALEDVMRAKPSTSREG
jgi:FkbM family methyltransferase